MAPPRSFDTWNEEKSYDNWRVYGETKLANILFTVRSRPRCVCVSRLLFSTQLRVAIAGAASLQLELNKRLEKAAPGVVAVSCHPVRELASFAPKPTSLLTHASTPGQGWTATNLQFTPGKPTQVFGIMNCAQAASLARSMTFEHWHPHRALSEVCPGPAHLPQPSSRRM